MPTDYRDKKTITLTAEFKIWNSKKEDYQYLATSEFTMKFPNRESQREVRYAVGDLNNWFSIDSNAIEAVQSIQGFFQASVAMVLNSSNPEDEIVVYADVNEMYRRKITLNDPLDYS